MCGHAVGVDRGRPGRLMADLLLRQHRKPDLFSFDSVWQGAYFTDDDFTYAIGGIEFREIGEIKVTLGKGGTATASASYGLAVFKDWNFDYGKKAAGIPLDDFA